MKLLFVYNADSGLFNTMADIGHKIFSPDTYQCDLCQLTHGYFSERSQWRAFVKQLEVDCRFIHRDEFHREFPGQPDPLPAIFIQTGDQLKLCIGSDQLHEFDRLELLIEAVKSRCLDEQPLS